MSDLSKRIVFGGAVLLVIGGLVWLNVSLLRTLYPVGISVPQFTDAAKGGQRPISRRTTEPGPTGLGGTRWVLTHMTNYPEFPRYFEDYPITLQFDEAGETIKGYALVDCITYHAAVTMQGDALTVADLREGFGARCPSIIELPRGLMPFFETLKTAHSLRMHNPTTLVISSETETLTFTPDPRPQEAAQPSPLEGTRWQLAAIDEVPSGEAMRITLRFSDIATFFEGHGLGLCDYYTGSYAITAEGFEVATFERDFPQCTPTTDEAVALAERFEGRFTTSTTYRLSEGQQLTLSGPQGSLTFVPDSLDQRIEHQAFNRHIWRLVALNGEQLPADTIAYVRIFQASMYAETGCGELRAYYTLRDEAFSLTETAREPDGRCHDNVTLTEEQRQRYLTALRAADTLTLRDDGALVISGPQGELVFERAEW